MNRSWLRGLHKAVRGTKTSRLPRMSTPHKPIQLVSLEDRITPVAYYVDPDFIGQPAGPATFNPGEPNEMAVTIGTNAFGTIAEALAKAEANAGLDQIYLSNGTHDVDPSTTLAVTDDLELIGSGQAATTILVTNDTAASTGSDSATFRVEGVLLNVSKLTFDGAGATGDPTSKLVGSAFRYESGTGTVSEVQFQNVIDEFDPTNPWGIGIVAIGAGANVGVFNSSFEEMGRVGVYYYGGATGVVSGSTFVGRVNAQFGYGVQASEDAQNVFITGSTFTGFTGTDLTNAAGAIFISDDLGADENGDLNNANEPSSAIIIGNSITNNQYGVIVGGDIGQTDDTSTAYLEFNTFSGNGIGVDPADKVFGTAVLTDTASTVQAPRNFWGDPAGPSVDGEAVGNKVVFQEVGTNPNDGVLITPPPVEAVTPPATGTFEERAAAASNTYIADTDFDITQPTATFGPVVTFNTPTVDVLVTFSEPVTGLTAGDFTLGGTAPGLNINSVAAGANPGEFIVTIATTGEGDITLGLPERVVQDATGNFNLETPSAVVAISDRTAPTVSVTALVGTLPVARTDPFSVSINFSESVVGFTAGDITLNGSPGATVVGFTPNADNSVYTVTIGGFTGAGNVSITLAAGIAADKAGNLTPALPTTLVADGTAPVATVTSPDGEFPLTFADPMTVTISFSETVVGFTASDIVLGGTQVGGQVQSLTSDASGKVYTATIGGFTTKGDVTFAIPAGAATDAVGNPSVAVAEFTLATADVTAPTVTITGTSATFPIPFVSPFGFNVNFSEPVVGFDAADIVFGGTAKGGKVLSIEDTSGGNRTTFFVTVGSFQQSGEVTITIPDGAVTDDVGNANIGVGPVTVAVPVDTTAPTATFTAGDGSALPLTFADTLTFRVVFSEAVTGFTASDIVLGGTQQGGAIQNFVAAGDGITFTVTVGGFTQPGSLTAVIPAGAVADLQGNLNQSIGPVVVATAADTIAPTLTITSPSGTLPVTLSAGPLLLTFTFSEAVTGLTAADIALGGTATGAVVQSITPQAGGAVYTIAIGGFTGAGTITVALSADAVQDAAGNGNAAVADTLVGNFQVVPFARGFVAGGDRGIPQPFITIDQDLKTGPAVFPFDESYTGGVRVATGDVNGDGTLDIIVGTGVGISSKVIVYDGTDNSKILFSFSPFEASFTGGVFVSAADLNGDGKAEVIVSPDETGGPRVRIMSGTDAAQGVENPIFDFFGIADPNFRGGARTGTGDINGDGVPDLLVAAGFGGGPRVSVFDGKLIAQGEAKNLFNDFFGYEDTLRNGVYVAGGDLDGDGFADIILGAGPGGGPRVRVLSGQALLTDGSQVEVANFFSGDDSNRGGVRVAGRDINNDGLVDIITGPGETGGSLIRIYQSGEATPTELDLFDGFGNGVYVG